MTGHFEWEALNYGEVAPVNPLAEALVFADNEARLAGSASPSDTGSLDASAATALAVLRASKDRTVGRGVLPAPCAARTTAEAPRHPIKR
ncbi:hypothetical protein [Sanguibacter sp. 25GB23B1]|uniref:hypothetical protein n=1 Tax=unclassified Sanguibacter TaxID=2645534 RepID=UPI0032AFB157